jgi:D-alanine transaminase
MHISRAGRRPPPGRIAYVDGRYIRHGAAGVHVEDRGLQFADSVYEVIAVSNARLVDAAPHILRLEKSLSSIGMAMPVCPASLAVILNETARRNQLREGLLYLQITRGAAPRAHAAPDDTSPTVIVTAKRMDASLMETRRAAGVAVMTTADIRWARCDIKSTGLLPNVLAKTEARKQGADEAWFVDGDGFVTEGSSTNAWIVGGDGEPITRSLRDNILAGITRGVLLQALSDAGIAARERAFSVEEAYGAREAFISSATGGVIPVVKIDGKPVGSGAIGPVAKQMHALYCELSRKISMV